MSIYDLTPNIGLKNIKIGSRPWGTEMRENIELLDTLIGVLLANPNPDYPAQVINNTFNNITNNNPEPMAYSFEYDANGNILQLIEQVEGLPRISTYEYDLLDNVIKANILYDNIMREEIYTYNGNGEIISISVTESNY